MLLTLIMLGTFAIGLYRIDYESLTIDEADVVAFAQEDWGTLLAKVTQPGENGPLYLLLLHGWISLAGTSEFALRFLSLAFTIATLPLLYLLGRRLIGSSEALMACLLFTCSTYVLQYSQMIKMYTMVIFLAVLSGYLLLRGLEHSSEATSPEHVPSPSKGGGQGEGDARRASNHTGTLTWIAYTIVTSAAMYTHVFGALLIPWHIVYAIIEQRREGRLVLPWLLSLGLLTLPYLPLAVMRLAALRNPETLTRQFTGPRDLIGMLTTLAREYGTLWDAAPNAWLKWGFVLLTVVGLAAAVWRDKGQGTRDKGMAFQLSHSVFLILGITVPVLITFSFVTLGAPLFSSRYLIITLPCFYLLWGAGIVGMARISANIVGAQHATPLPRGVSMLPAIAIVFLFVGVNGARWSQSTIVGQRYHEDWRSGTALLEARQVRGEPVILLKDANWRAVNYYSTAPLALVSLEGGPDKPPDMSRTPTLPARGSVWLMAAHFEVGPDLAVVEQWLESYTTLVDKTWVTGVMVSQYQVR